VEPRIYVLQHRSLIEYAKVYIPYYEKDKIPVSAMGSGEEEGIMMASKYYYFDTSNSRNTFRTGR
jgi:hypothetical protein